MLNNKIPLSFQVVQNPNLCTIALVKSALSLVADTGQSLSQFQ